MHSFLLTPILKLFFVSVILTGCGRGDRNCNDPTATNYSSRARTDEACVYEEIKRIPQLVAELPKEIKETSGLALIIGELYTHNDYGNDGILYAIGGRKISMGLLEDAVEGYDIVTDEWSGYSPMITPRAGLGGTALDGIIYTFGGELMGSSDRDHEAFDPSENSWQTLPPMPIGKHGMGVAAVNGKIYIIGGGPQAGFSQSTTVQVFTPD
jgi:hypothetical protein